MEIALQGGEDYELLFTAPAKHHRHVLRVLRTNKGAHNLHWRNQTEDLRSTTRAPLGPETKTFK